MSSPDIFIAVVIGAVVAGGLRTLLMEPHRKTQARLACIESNLDRLLQHFGLEPPSTLSPAVRDLLRQGKKINAIKAYREETGAGLREAKDAVERVQ